MSAARLVEPPRPDVDPTRLLTEQTAMQAGTIGRWIMEYAALEEQFNAYRRDNEHLVTDLATRLEQSLEGIAEALIANEEVGERARYWESRALHAEGQLAPRDRLRVVRPGDGA